MSSASKYAGLPDIDSAPDVYETPDMPPDSTYTLDSESDSDSHLTRASSPATSRRLAQQGQQGTSAVNENIDNGRLDAVEARKRFGESTFARRQEGSAGDRSRRRRLPSTSTYELRTSASAEDAKESPLERLRRLRSEVAELEEDVLRDQAAQATAGDGTTEGTTGQAAKGKGKVEITPKVLLQQLQLLRGDLGALKIDGAESDRLEGQGVKEAQSGDALGQSGIDGSKSPIPPPKPAASIPSTPNPATKGLPAAPASEADLEKRLSELERILGASEADLDEAHLMPSPLVPSITRLSHLLTLLTQPRHLDSVSRRVKVLVSDLERLHESRRKLGDTRPLNVAIGGAVAGGGMTVAVPGVDGKLPSLAASTTGRPPTTAEQLPPDALQRIDSLFALLPRLDPLLPLTPRLLARLRSLAALHASSANFAEDFQALKTEVSRMGESETGLQEVINGLDKSLTENETRMKANLDGLDVRIGEVLKRMEMLQ